MGDWNLKVFKVYCKDQGLDDALLYAESLALKFGAAKYHRNRIQQKLESVNPKNISLDELLVHDFEIAFEMDALMMALNSMWDILAQLVNSCFCNIDRSEVSLVNLLKDYNHLIPPEIVGLLQNIRGNRFYTTITDFASASKHIQAIRGDICVNFQDSLEPVSYETNTFQRKHRQHSLTDKKVFECLYFTGKAVDKVGACIYRILNS